VAQISVTKKALTVGKFAQKRIGGPKRSFKGGDAKLKVK
jgi:hypothetical protein